MAADRAHAAASPRPSRLGRLGGRLGRRAIAARLGALLLIGGTAIFVLAALVLHSPETEVAAYWALAALLAVAAGIVLALPPRVAASAWIPGIIVATGIVSIIAGVYFNGERLGGPPAFSEFYFIWPAFYIGYFFTRRAIAAWLVLIGLLYAGVLAAIDVPEAGIRWVVTVSVVAGAAIALHVLRTDVNGLLGRLREAARTDPLTELLNRRGFDERFELELERARRTDAAVALVVGDLDRFKELNDRLGHGAGDTALAAVAQALTSGCRAIDTVARVGGEEFALLLPATDAEGGVDAAERLRREIGSIATSDGEGLTICFGVVEFPRHGHSPQELMNAADRALYDAKALGRDRTVCRDPESVATLA